MRKTPSGDFEVLIASAVADPKVRDVQDNEWTLDGLLAGKKLRLVFGDHASEMAKIAHNLAHAGKYAANKDEELMMREYATSFHDGSMEAHKDSQRHWIRDKGPMVECNIGFIETYRDPHGIRGEWEGKYMQICDLMTGLLMTMYLVRFRRNDQSRADKGFRQACGVCTRADPEAAMAERL